MSVPTHCGNARSRSLAHRQLATRRTLAVKVNQLLTRRKLSQAEAGSILGMPQPKVSAIRNLKLKGISLERLLSALAALGQHVEIIVEESTREIPPGIEVAANDHVNGER
jgi:predicted XRE-type DNA-binding protein